MSDTTERARALLEAARYEILPTKGIIDRLDGIPDGVAISVTASPAKGIEATVDLALAIAERGMPVIPHLAAKRFEDVQHLRDVLKSLSESDIAELFVVGGDGDAEGSFEDAESILGEIRDRGEWTIGIGGYPDGHPSIPDDILMKALVSKSADASHVITQMCFDMEAIESWIARIRDEGVELPVIIGIPGVVDRARLVSVGTRIGVGDSLRFLFRHRDTLREVITGSYSPTDFVTSLAESSLDIAGIHIYTFNQVQATAQWHAVLLAELS